jgi:quercetin dioxygenase-like cupin family protein
MTDTHSTTGTARRESRELEGALLHFGLEQELAELRSDLGRATGSRTAKTLAKSGGLRVMLIVVGGGVTIEPEAAAGASTLQVLDGRLRLSAEGRTQEVGPGELVVLSRNLREPIEAIQPSSFILTIAWPEGAGAWDEEARSGKL